MAPRSQLSPRIRVVGPGSVAPRLASVFEPLHVHAQESPKSDQLIITRVEPYIIRVQPPASGRGGGAGRCGEAGGRGYPCVSVETAEGIHGWGEEIMAKGETAGKTDFFGGTPLDRELPILKIPYVLRLSMFASSLDTLSDDDGSPEGIAEAIPHC